MGLAEPLGQAGGLLAEEEPAALPKGGLGVVLGRLGGGQPKVRDVVFVEQVLQIIIDPQIHHVPIIQARPLHGPVADVEPQGAHQVQAAAGGGAGAGDVAGVHGNFRFHQDDIQYNIRRLDPDKLSL